MDLQDFFTLKPSPDRDVIQAQMTSNGSVTGTVTDPPGAVITGAYVTLINAKTNNQATPITKNKSTFVASSVQPGTYTVTVKAADFKQTVVTDVSNPPSINVDIEAGYIKETVTVIDDGESIQMQTATAGATSTSPRKLFVQAENKICPI